MMLLYHAEQRRLRRIEADMAEAVAVGYSGARGGREGAHALDRFLRAARGG